MFKAFTIGANDYLMTVMDRDVMDKMKRKLSDHFLTSQGNALLHAIRSREGKNLHHGIIRTTYKCC